jgi:histo-blood group ABO system transferase
MAGIVFKVGLLVIASNKYIRFVEPLWRSARAHFLRRHHVTMLVFTNDRDFRPEAGQHVVPVDHLPWPGMTLHRYRFFDRVAHRLREMDYLYYCDADMLMVDTVGDEILGDRVAVIHPLFYDKPRATLPYESDPASLACVGPHEGGVYYMGGFNGGRSEDFLRMSAVLAERIDDDARRGIVAIWHDESHLNRYFIDNRPTVALSPSYGYPERMSLPFPCRILALDKDHRAMRS